MSLEGIIDDVLNVPFGAGKEPGEQGSVGWLMERVGYCTASRFKDVLDFTKAGKPGAKRTAYHWELVIERLTGKPVDHYANTAMEHGTMNEPAARMALEAATGCIVTETGFHKHTGVPFVGGSPDGFIDDDGGLEIKCPFNSAIHLQTVLNGMPEDHAAQCQGLMWITGRQYWLFASYDPRMPPELQLYTQRLERDEEYIANLDREVRKFLCEVSETVAKLQGAMQ